MIQLAVVLPAAVLIGWAAGAALDHWLHRHWIAIAGLLFGAVSGFVEIFRMVSAMSKD
jgi:F0F1-type ATP synthase assembly protein I